MIYHCSENLEHCPAYIAFSLMFLFCIYTIMSKKVYRENSTMQHKLLPRLYKSTTGYKS